MLQIRLSDPGTVALACYHCVLHYTSAETLVQYAEVLASKGVVSESPADQLKEFITEDDKELIAEGMTRYMGRQLCRLLGGIGGDKSFNPELLSSDCYNNVLDLVAASIQNGILAHRERRGGFKRSQCK